ncbi:MAG: hypothetical protein ACXAAK_14240, partial [Candidatus Thorarchaeota archaeon]
MVDQEYLQDKKVQKIDSDIRNFKTNLQKTKMDLEGLDARLDAEIDRHKSIAKSKRSAFEDLHSRMKSAELAWKVADKEYKSAQKNKDKTRSGLKKEF